jgi:hypothetical protein
MMPEGGKRVSQRGSRQSDRASISQRRTSGSEQSFFDVRRPARKQKARKHSVRWWCRPRQERPSK